MNIAYFNGKAVFSQKVRLKAKQTNIKGVLSYMACNDLQCLPPEELEFSFPVKAAIAAVTPAVPVPKNTSSAANSAKPKSTVSVPAKAASAAPATAATAPATQSLESTPAPAAAPMGVQLVPEKPVPATVTPAAAEVAVASPAEQSLGAIFLAGFLGGLAALLMPCIFPMLSLTVSYFTKQGKTRKQAVTKPLSTASASS